jgi:hypothetical protein
MMNVPPTRRSGHVSAVIAPFSTFQTSGLPSQLASVLPSKICVHPARSPKSIGSGAVPQPRQREPGAGDPGGGAVGRGVAGEGVCAAGV